MQIRISTKTKGGFKLIARKGFSVQEVFVITTLNIVEIQAELNNVLRK